MSGSEVPAHSQHPTFPPAPTVRVCSAHGVLTALSMQCSSLLTKVSLFHSWFGIETLTHQPLACPEEPHLEAGSINWVQSSNTGVSGWVVMPEPCNFQFLQIHLFVP